MIQHLSPSECRALASTNKTLARIAIEAYGASKARGHADNGDLSEVFRVHVLMVQLALVRNISTPTLTARILHEARDNALLKARGSIEVPFNTKMMEQNLDYAKVFAENFGLEPQSLPSSFLVS